MFEFELITRKQFVNVLAGRNFIDSTLTQPLLAKLETNDFCSNFLQYRSKMQYTYKLMYNDKVRDCREKLTVSVKQLETQ